MADFAHLIGKSLNLITDEEKLKGAKQLPRRLAPLLTTVTEGKELTPPDVIEERKASIHGKPNGPEPNLDITEGLRLETTVANCRHLPGINPGLTGYDRRVPPDTESWCRPASNEGITIKLPFLAPDKGHERKIQYFPLDTEQLFLEGDAFQVNSYNSESQSHNRAKSCNARAFDKSQNMAIDIAQSYPPCNRSYEKRNKHARRNMAKNFPAGHEPSDLELDELEREFDDIKRQRQRIQFLGSSNKATKEFVVEDIQMTYRKSFFKPAPSRKEKEPGGKKIDQPQNVMINSRTCKTKRRDANLHRVNPEATSGINQINGQQRLLRRQQATQNKLRRDDKGSARNAIRSKGGDTRRFTVFEFLEFQDEHCHDEPLRPGI